jgi:ribonuclease P protein component
MRLRTSAEFERVYRRGAVYRGRLFSVHALPGDAERPRLGLSVSKKVGSAVARNLVRRRLREVFRAVAGDLEPGMDIVVSARPAAADASFEELGKEFARALRRLDLLGNEG